MINLLIALALGVLAFVAFFIPFNWVAAIFPGLVVFFAAYVLLARRTSKQIEAATPEVTKALQARRIDQAVSALKELRPLGRWQFLVGPALDAQIGMILYAHKQDAEAARPYLEEAYVKNWQARAMLAAIYFKKKDYSKMEQVMEQATRSNKKASMLWAAYAWMEWKRGETNKAMEIFGRGLQHQPDDERLKSNLLALQNGKRLKMKAYEPDWWALLLERPPMQQQVLTGRPSRGGGRRGGTRRR